MHQQQKALQTDQGIENQDFQTLNGIDPGSTPTELDFSLLRSGVVASAHVDWYYLITGFCKKAKGIRCVRAAVYDGSIRRIWKKFAAD
jgi:hypothetical protein